jgi:hypothetical protein
MIERSKLNERLSDMTPNKMLLDVSVSPNFVFKIQQNSYFNSTEN